MATEQTLAQYAQTIEGRFAVTDEAVTQMRVQMGAYEGVSSMMQTGLENLRTQVIAAGTTRDNQMSTQGAKIDSLGSQLEELKKRLEAVIQEDRDRIAKVEEASKQTGGIKAAYALKPLLESKAVFGLGRLGND